MGAVVVASANGGPGMAAAMDVLRRGGSALDAVEAGTRLVEDSRDDTSVGTGGLPNLLGEVELEASIMDGRALTSGAVAALTGYPNPISVARRVMQELPHALLAGLGAERFAAECGFARAELLAPESCERWRKGLEKVLPSPASVEQELARSDLRTLAGRLASDPENTGGTVNFLARGREGNIASAVSTSGWAWKYPGRVGDSACIGAGNYCDNRFGAAACKGRGEMSIRTGAARSVVLYLEQGMALDEALKAAMRNLWPLEDPWYGPVSVVAMDAAGRHAAASNQETSYLYWTEEMESCVTAPAMRIARPEQ